MIYCCSCGYYFGESQDKPKACPDCFRVDKIDNNVWEVNNKIPDGLFIKVVVFLTAYECYKDLKTFVIQSGRLKEIKLNKEEIIK